MDKYVKFEKEKKMKETKDRISKWTTTTQNKAWTDKDRCIRIIIGGDEDYLSVKQCKKLILVLQEFVSEE